MRVLGAKAASRARRWLLGMLLRLPGGNSDPTALLARFPDESLVPLRRQRPGPDPRAAAPASR